MGKRKVTPIAMAKLLQLYKEGKNQYEVAQALGVSQPTVSRALDRYPVIRRTYTVKEPPMYSYIRGMQIEGDEDDAA